MFGASAFVGAWAGNLSLMGVGGFEAAAGANYLVQEVDGTSKFLLEDGTGAILLE